MTDANDGGSRGSEPAAMRNRAPILEVLRPALENPATLEADLEALWHREMAAGVYAPVWHDVETEDGPVAALCFVANPAHTSYAGDLPVERMVAVIARAHGSNGPCRDYLAFLVDALAGHGLFDPAMTALLRLVDAEREGRS